LFHIEVDIWHLPFCLNDIIVQFAHRKEIKIDYSVPVDFLVLADKNMLKTILRNLITNAIKITNINGFIEVTVYRQNNAAVISLSDNGIGISVENQEKIWNNSENISTYGTAYEQGTGLGLMLCKELVEKHGGKIWVESLQNEGSTFRFTVPLFVHT